MPTGLAQSRPLQFPLNRSIVIEGETPNEPPIEKQTPDGFPPGADEKIKIVLELSLSEYVALSSAIDVGRDIAYSDDAIYIWWIWTRSLLSMDLCSDIANCITSSTEVQGAIYNLANSNSYDSLRELGQSQTEDNLVGDSNPECDEDILFGQCLQLVQYLHGLNLDILEIIEIATNPIEATAQIMPDGANASGATGSAVYNWVSFVQQNIADNYNAQITQAYLEDRACDLFCLAKDNGCAIDPATMYGIWQERLEATVTVNSLINETILYLISGIWVGEEIADFMFFAQLAFRSQLGDWIGRVAYLDIYQRLAVYANDPNPDWSVLCEDCGWVYETDWLSTQGEWYAQDLGYGDMATWANGVGWESADIQTSSTGYSRISLVQIDIPPSEVSRVTVAYNLTKGSFSGNVLAVRALCNIDGGGDDNEALTSSEAVTGNNQTITLDLLGASYTSVQIWLRSSLQATPSYSGVAKIVSVKVEGLGENPFE